MPSVEPGRQPSSPRLARIVGPQPIIISVLASTTTVTAVACLTLIIRGPDAVRVCQPGQYLTIRPDTTFHSQPFRPLLISLAIQLAVALLASIDPATPRTIPYLVPCMDNPQFHPPHYTHSLDGARSKLAQTPPVGLVSPRIQAVLSALHVGSGCSGAWNCSLQSILMLSDAT